MARLDPRRVLGRIGVVAGEQRVAAVEAGADVRVPHGAEDFAQVGHRHPLGLAEVDPAQECDISGHAGTVPAITA